MAAAPSDIAFVTTCKGRLHHLKETLPLLVGLAPGEIVVVDYGCPQAAGAWVAAAHPRVRVVHVTDDPGFCAGRARNLGATATRSPWICFIDADVMAAPGWMAWMCGHLDPRCFYRAGSIAGRRSLDTWGSVICPRTDFERIGGFDEAFIGWGGEDDDLYIRLKTAGLRETFYPGAFVKAIPHPDDERTAFREVKRRALQLEINSLYMKTKQHVAAAQPAGRDVPLDCRRDLMRQITATMLAWDADRAGPRPALDFDVRGSGWSPPGADVRFRVEFTPAPSSERLGDAAAGFGDDAAQTGRLAEGWDAAAHDLWRRDARADAIQAVLAAINAAGHQKPVPLLMQFSYYLFLFGDIKAAALPLEHILKQDPHHVEALRNLAVCRSRTGSDEEAVARARSLLEKQPDDPLAWDILAKSLHALGRDDEAADAGTHALLSKDRGCDPARARGWALPSGRPEGVAAAPGKRNVISFSLWGANPRYLRGLLRNLLLAPDLHPGWKVRVHLDSTVPEEFVTLIHETGGETVLQPDGQTVRQKLAWRFLVADDHAVGRFLVRDADSVFSLRESLAVRAWTESDRWFHVMRDWWTHTDLVLAGMWGGIAGVLPPMAVMLERYAPPALNTPNVDQWFLRDVVWAFMRQSCLVHDRCFRMPHTLPMPGPLPAGNEHVGQSEFSARREKQSRLLAAWIDRHPCLGMPETFPAA
jgi:hypothetical protein